MSFNHDVMTRSLTSREYNVTPMKSRREEQIGQKNGKIFFRDLSECRSGTRIGADDFRELIHRARSGDEEAATRLAREFEPFVHRVARFRLRTHRSFERLRRDFDSMDLCQSVFQSFFQGLRIGRCDLNRPEDLQGLLTSMVHWLVLTKARKGSVKLREVLEFDPVAGFVDRRLGPDDEASRKDFLESCLQRLSEDELDLFNRRLDRQSWVDIGNALGDSPESSRKRLERAINRV